MLELIAKRWYLPYLEVVETESDTYFAKFDNLTVEDNCKVKLEAKIQGFSQIIPQNFASTSS